MAEETTQLNRLIGQSYNQYFTWNNNTAFYVLSPVYLFQFYNTQVRIWDEWNTGWVGGFHSVESGILPTQFAGALCQKVADLIYGDGVLFESTDDKNLENASIDFLGDLNKRIGIKSNVKDSILKSCQLGNSLLKLNKGESDLWIDCIAGNRFFCNLNSRGEIVKALSYVNIYTAGVAQKGKSPDSYGLVEVRYYDTDENGDIVRVNGERQPMVVYKIYKLNGVANVFDSNPSDFSYKFDDLPRPVRREFREEYETLMLDTPEKLPLRNLGVYLIKHTQYVTAMPNIKLGESCLARIINYLPKYDAIDSEETIDLRISRPKIIVPDFMGKGKNNNADQLNDYTGIIYEKVPIKSDKDLMPISFIPTPREEHFIKMKEDVIKKVCGNLGIATSSLFSDIADGRGNVTAREISSEDSNTVLYVNNKRQILLPNINEMISDILAFYGQHETVKATFSPAGASNKSVTTDITTKLKNAGLISEYQAVKEQHPEWTEQQIIEELDEIHKTQELNNQLVVGREIRYTGKNDSQSSSENENEDTKEDEKEDLKEKDNSTEK